MSVYYEEYILFVPKKSRANSKRNSVTAILTSTNAVGVNEFSNFILKTYKI